MLQTCLYILGLANLVVAFFFTINKTPKKLKPFPYLIFLPALLMGMYWYYVEVNNLTSTIFIAIIVLILVSVSIVPVLISGNISEEERRYFK